MASGIACYVARRSQKNATDTGIDPICAEAKERLQTCIDAEQDVREQAEADLKFAFANKPQDQWEEAVLKERGDRPCYTYNRIGEEIDQAVSDQRQQRPQIKVRGVDDNSDPALADIYNGLIRNIEVLSDAETVYDEGFDYKIRGGFAYWRVIPEYSTDTTFDQDLFVRPVQSQFSVYMDPAARHPTKRDSNWCLLSVWMTDDAYRAQYGEDVAKQWVDADDDEVTNWRQSNMVRVAEYYRRKPVKRTLILLSDGRTMFEDKINLIREELDAEGITETKRRVVETFEVEWYKLSATSVLDGPRTYRTQWIPVVRDIGKRLVLNDEEMLKGMTRDAKDAQRSYNYMRSDLAEDVLMRPKAPVFLAEKTLENEAFRDAWNKAHKLLFNYLPYVPDPNAPGGGAPIPNTSTGLDAGKLAVAQQDIADIKATTGNFDPYLGDQGTAQGPDATSGVAVKRWGERSGNASFIYHDNHKKAIEQTGRILVEMIPLIYDGTRTVRIIGRDGTERFVRINTKEQAQPGGKVEIFGDITQAKFDVEVDSGPSYATQREEAADKLMRLGEIWPAVFELAPDLIAKGLDIPNQEEFIARVRKGLIAKGVVEPNKDDPEEVTFAQSLKGSGQNQALDMLLGAQAQEAQANAAESMADVAAKRAKALKDLQDAVAQALKNMVAEQQLRIDPSGVIQAMVAAAGGGNGSGTVQ